MKLAFWIAMTVVFGFAFGFLHGTERRLEEECDRRIYSSSKTCGEILDECWGARDRLFKVQVAKAICGVAWIVSWAALLAITIQQ